MYIYKIQMYIYRKYVNILYNRRSTSTGTVLCPKFRSPEIML